MNYAEPSIKDYDERRRKPLGFWKAQSGRQSGDPAKLARALGTIAGQATPPLPPRLKIPFPQGSAGGSPFGLTSNAVEAARVRAQPPAPTNHEPPGRVPNGAS